MKTVRLTMAQALLRFLDNQYTEVDGKEIKFVRGVFGIFGHSRPGLTAGVWLAKPFMVPLSTRFPPF